MLGQFVELPGISKQLQFVKPSDRVSFETRFVRACIWDDSVYFYPHDAGAGVNPAGNLDSLAGEFHHSLVVEMDRDQYSASIRLEPRPYRDNGGPVRENLLDNH